jgi:hypothetical protein
MSHVRVIRHAATFYARPNGNLRVMELPIGIALELGKAGDNRWVAGAVRDGRKGFLPGATTDGRARLLQTDVDVHAAPSRESPVIGLFQKHAQFDLIERAQAAGGVWVRIRDSAGIDGFVEGNTRVLIRAGGPTESNVHSQKGMALRNMGFGALSGIVGILISTMTCAQGRDMYLFLWGPLMFGGWRFLKGLAQFLGH